MTTETCSVGVTREDAEAVEGTEENLLPQRRRGHGVTKRIRIGDGFPSIWEFLRNSVTSLCLCGNKFPLRALLLLCVLTAALCDLGYFVTVTEGQSFTRALEILGSFHPWVIPTLERRMMTSPRNCTGDTNLPFTTKSKNIAEAG